MNCQSWDLVDDLVYAIVKDTAIDSEVVRRAVRPVAERYMDRLAVTPIQIETLRTGGAVCVVEVRHVAGVWCGVRLVSGYDIAENRVSRLAPVNWALRDLVDHFESEATLPGDKGNT